MEKYVMYGDKIERILLLIAQVVFLLQRVHMRRHTDTVSPKATDTLTTRVYPQRKMLRLRTGEPVPCFIDAVLTRRLAVSHYYCDGDDGL